MKRRTLLAVLWVACACLQAQERVDLAVVHRIKSEALENSKVMDHLFYLADVHGPRLTGSPGFQRAAEWTLKQLEGWGLQNVKTEKWGPYGRSWSLARYSGNMIEPQTAPVSGVALPWTPGTNGLVAANAVLAPLPLTSDAALEQAMSKFKGTLKGKIVLVETPPQIAMQTAPAGSRYTDAELASLALAQEPQPGRPRTSARARGAPRQVPEGRRSVAGADAGRTRAMGRHRRRLGRLPGSEGPRPAAYGRCLRRAIQSHRSSPRQKDPRAAGVRH